MRPAYHTIVVGLVSGLMLFALIATVVRVFLRLRGREASPLATAADRAAVAAASLGIALTVVGIITGFLVWPLEATLRSPVMKNKILASFLSVAFWGAFLAVRFRRGPQLWSNLTLGVYAVMLAASGFVFGMITSSIGGDAAGNPSGFENIVRIFGVETRFTFYLPTWLNLVVIVLGVLALVVAFTARSHHRGDPVGDRF